MCVHNFQQLLDGYGKPVVKSAYVRDKPDKYYLFCTKCGMSKEVIV